jgi:hypothetical protein
MSKFEQMETKLTEGQYLAKALEAIGYKPVVDWKGQTLRGYGGAIQPEKTQIVIPRAQPRLCWRTSASCATRPASSAR